MTRKEALTALAEAKRINTEEEDIERAHSEADGVLCELLTSLGFEDVVAAWSDIDKWYA